MRQPERNVFGWVLALLMCAAIVFLVLSAFGLAG